MKNKFLTPKRNNFIHYLLAATVVLLVLAGCRKEADETNDISPNQSNNPFRILTTPTYKGVYVDTFDGILGDKRMSMCNKIYGYTSN